MVAYEKGSKDVLGLGPPDPAFIARGEQNFSRFAALFRDFIEAQAHVTITGNSVEVAFGKRAHSPLLLAAGFQHTDVAVPWWGGRKLKISFG